MGKIIPGQQYADIGVYDKTEDFFKLMQFIQNADATYQTAKSNHEGDLSNSLLSLIENSKYVDSNETMTSLMQSFETLGGDSNDTDNLMLKQNYKFANAIFKGKESHFRNFEKSFETTIQKYNDPNSILNPKNFNLEKINELGVMGVRDVMLEVQGLRDKLFDSQGVPLYKEYQSHIGGGTNANQLNSHFGYWDSILTGVASSWSRPKIDKDGNAIPGSEIVSQEEFDFIIANPNLSSADVEKARKERVAESARLIQSSQSRFDNLSNQKRNLQVAQTETIGQIIAAGQQPGMTNEQFAELYAGLNVAPTDPIIELLKGYSPSQLKAGYKLVGDKKYEIPENVVTLYQDMMKKVNTHILREKTGITNNIDIYNAWAPYPYTGDVVMPSDWYENGDSGDTGGTGDKTTPVFSWDPGSGKVQGTAKDYPKAMKLWKKYWENQYVERGIADAANREDMITVTQYRSQMEESKPREEEFGIKQPLKKREAIKIKNFSEDVFPNIDWAMGTNNLTKKSRDFISEMAGGGQLANDLIKAIRTWKATPIKNKEKTREAQDTINALLEKIE